VTATEVQAQIQAPGAQGRVRRRLALWLFASFNCLYLLTSTGRVRTLDEYTTLYQSESMVLRHSTAIPQAVALNNFYGRYDRQGKPRAAYPPGHAAAAAPWYAVGAYALSRMPRVPADANDLVVGFSSCLSSATFAALAVALAFLLLSGIGVDLRSSLFAAGILGLGTPLLAYSAWFFSEPLATAMLLGAGLVLFGHGGGSAVSGRAAAAAGALLGLAVWVRPTHVIAIAVFLAALVIRDGKAGMRAAVALAGVSAAIVALLLAYNVARFGNAFEFGYPVAAERGKQLNSFHTPLLIGLYGFLLSPGKSIFLFAPPVLLAFAGLRELWRRDRGLAALAALLPLTYLLFFARYTQWEGGYCFGPRYLLPATAALCLGLGPALANGGKGKRWLAIGLLVAGIMVQSIGLATSFMEDQATTGRYYDVHWNYRLSYSLAGQVHLLFHYLGSRKPARLGLGWDRWFVFLHKGGVSAGTLAAWAALMVVGLVASVIGLRRSLQQAA